MFNRPLPSDQSFFTLWVRLSVQRVEGAGVGEKRQPGPKKGRGRTAGHGVPSALVVDADSGKEMCC